MEDPYIEILDYLYKQGINNTVDIYFLLNKKFTKETNFGYLRRTDQIDLFLKKIKEDSYLEYTISPADFKTQNENIDLTILAHITVTGFQFLNNVRRDKSTLETNNSMVTIAKEQSSTNKIIAGNSTIQTNILNRQKWILWATVGVAACSAFIAYLSYQKDVPNNLLPQELKVINKRIDTLQHMLPQTKSYSSPVTTAKKTLPKNLH